MLVQEDESLSIQNRSSSNHITIFPNDLSLFNTIAYPGLFIQGCLFRFINFYNSNIKIPFSLTKERD